MPRLSTSLVLKIKKEDKREGEEGKEVDCGFSHGRITRQSAGSCSGPHCGMNVFLCWGSACSSSVASWNCVRCIVSSPLCGCRLVDGSLLSCCSRLHLRAMHVTRLPGNRCHPLVFICCRLVASRLQRRLSVSHLRPCRHCLCRLVGLIGLSSCSRLYLRAWLATRLLGKRCQPHVICCCLVSSISSSKSFSCVVFVCCFLTL